VVTGEGSRQYGLGDPGSISVKVSQVFPPIHLLVVHRAALSDA
jgi:hypothetical protein